MMEMERANIPFNISSKAEQGFVLLIIIVYKQVRMKEKEQSGKFSGKVECWTGAGAGSDISSLACIIKNVIGLWFWLE